MRVCRWGYFVVVLVGLAWVSSAQASRVNTNHGVAVEGYDVVAYHTAGAAVKGLSKFSHTWRGATWNFVSARNRDLFLTEPGRYAPQFGGYCSYSTSKGYTSKIDPNAFSVIDGRLYLSFSKKIQSIWLKQPDTYIDEAMDKWPKLLRELHASE